MKIFFFPFIILQSDKSTVEYVFETDTYAFKRDGLRCLKYIFNFCVFFTNWISSRGHLDFRIRVQGGPFLPSLSSSLNKDIGLLG